METFSALLAICAGNSPVPGEFPPQRPVTQSFDVFFDLRPKKYKEWMWPHIGVLITILLLTMIAMWNMPHEIWHLNFLS